MNGCLWKFFSLMHTIHGHILAGHLHLWACGICMRGAKMARVYDGCIFLCVPTRISVTCQVLRWAGKVLMTTWTALLRELVRRLSMCLLVQNERGVRAIDHLVGAIWFSRRESLKSRIFSLRKSQMLISMSKNQSLGYFGH